MYLYLKDEGAQPLVLRFVPEVQGELNMISMGNLYRQVLEQGETVVNYLDFSINDKSKESITFGSPIYKDPATRIGK